MKFRIAKVWAVAMCSGMSCLAQIIPHPPNGGNQKSIVTQFIGPVEVTIVYHSPDVHGPNGEDREGHIWGELVHYGLKDFGFGPAKQAPWRAGANECTTIKFSHDVRIENSYLQAGTYGLFLITAKEGAWTWIFSNKANDWGSFFYDASEDQLRVQVLPDTVPYTEYLTFGFEERKVDSATAFLQWEHMRVPMHIAVPDVMSIYLESIKDQLYASVNPSSSMYQSWFDAATFCLEQKINLEQGLRWADTAIHAPYFGHRSYRTYALKAKLLSALDREEAAWKEMQVALTMSDATAQVIYHYGKSLLTAGKIEKAMNVFAINAQLNTKEIFYTALGLARVYSAMGHKGKSVKYWKLVLKNVPDSMKQFIPSYEKELLKSRT